MGRRYANLVCKKADVDMNKRAGELDEEEVKMEILNNTHHSQNVSFLCPLSPRLRESLQLCKTLVNTRFLIGS